jgi:hypothetical protein
MAVPSACQQQNREHAAWRGAAAVTPRLGAQLPQRVTAPGYYGQAGRPAEYAQLAGGGFAVAGARRTVSSVLGREVAVTA